MIGEKMITIPELYALTDLDKVIHIPTGEEYTVDLYPNLIRFYNSEYKSQVKIALGNPTTYQSYNVAGLYAVGYTTTMLMEFKPKEETKMKTKFTMLPQTTKEKTYPKFMLRKADGIIVLFFEKECGVVVCGNHHIQPKYFLSNWDMDLFTPVEGCSVTFSDKD